MLTNFFNSYPWLNVQRPHKNKIIQFLWRTLYQHIPFKIIYIMCNILDLLFVWTSQVPESLFIHLTWEATWSVYHCVTFSLQVAGWCPWPLTPTPSSSSAGCPTSPTAVCVWTRRPNRFATQDNWELLSLATPRWSSPVLDLRMSSSWKSTEKSVWRSQHSDLTFTFCSAE